MERLSATTPLRINGVALIPIQRVSIEPSRTGGVARIRAHSEPRAIVVVEGTGQRVLGLDGAEISLEPLLEQVPGLAETIELERLRT